MLITIQIATFLNGRKYSTGSHRVHYLDRYYFFIYINDLSKSVSDKSSPILFADDTSFIIANRDETECKFKTNEIFN
jgi:hypothetical protein